MKRPLLVAALAALAGLAACGKQEAAAPAAAPKTELLVYTATEAEELPGLKKAFEEANPTLSVNWVRDSTGIITARLLAEKDHPQADVIWGLAVSSVIVLKQAGMLEPYAPPGLANLDARFIDADSPPSWTGTDVFEAAICVNTVEAEKRKLPIPQSWADLTSPVYKGQLSMPSPASSGTGFLSVVGWIEQFGNDKAWIFMDQLHANMARYTHSGAKPCKEAAAGEIAIGIGLGFTAAKQIAKGAPLTIIYPTEGVGWDMESTAIVKGTAKLAAAQRLVDFAISKRANELYNEAYPVIAYKGIAKPVPNYPADVESKMIKMDFNWAATHRQEVLGEWIRRYDAKSEPKTP